MCHSISNVSFLNKSHLNLACKPAPKFTFETNYASKGEDYLIYMKPRVGVKFLSPIWNVMYFASEIEVHALNMHVNDKQLIVEATFRCDTSLVSDTYSLP